VANPYQCFYHNPHKYSTVTLLKWTKKYLESSLFSLHKQYCDILGQVGYGVIEACRVPDRTRNRLTKQDGVFKVRFLGRWYYIVPTDTLARLERNERRRLERQAITGRQRPEEPMVMQEYNVKKRRLVRHAGCLRRH